MAQKSRIKRVISRKLKKRMDSAKGKAKEELAAFAEREAQDAIEKMRDKGWKLVTRLEDGEAVFSRDDAVVALHIQLPSVLYKKLDVECKRRETTKRQLVTVALERYLEQVG